MNSIRDSIKQQKRSNKDSLKYHPHFEAHRLKQTEVLLSCLNKSTKSVCVLGAGNCYDLNLDALVNQVESVHLVDIDREALTRARSKLHTKLRDKITLHAPVDVSGANKYLEDWRDMRVQAEDLMTFPEAAVESLLDKLGGQFDVVLSSCLLSQLQLVYRQVMGESHPLYQAGIVTLIITHFRLLLSLCKSGGRALFVSDVSSNDIAPLDQYQQGSSMLDPLTELGRTNQLFNYLEPQFLQTLNEQDPFLHAQIRSNNLLDAWLWKNGPLRTFLVYAMELERR